MAQRGVERYLVSVALALPLAIATVGFAQLPGVAPAFAPVRAEGPVTKRPVSPAQLAPPPTLAPAPTPVPTPTSAPTVGPSPTAPVRGSSYVVQPGDELKHIAAEYGVSIWKIIEANGLNDPDNLRVGQVLQIPKP